MKSRNYFQVILTSGKTHPKLYKDPQRAIRAVGAKNILKLREVLAEQVNAKYTDVDGITYKEEEDK